MIVAAAAGERQPHPNCAHRLGLVEHILHAVFGSNAAAFAVDHVVAVEARGQHLLLCRIRQQVTGNLFHGKLTIQSR